MWATLYGLLSPAEAMVLERLLDVAAGDRVSALELLRRGPTSETGKDMIGALMRVSTIVGLGMGSKDLSGVPQSKVADLARYGSQAKRACCAAIRCSADWRRCCPQWCSWRVRPSTTRWNYWTG